ncbi:MAG: amidohydrolase family protein [Immundisolibacterales bacterium]|nr:amidohydrolase family protein [Immundisolibacterales bacterium]
MATNDDWLARTDEPVLEPELPICDPHHHLWDFQTERVEPRYFLDELLEDLGSGHNVVSTVFIECGAMFKASGPEELRPIGETEFVAGIAAMSESGLYGPTRVAAGIVGAVHLMRGDGAADVLDRQIVAGGGRFRGIRQGGTWDASPEVPVHRTGPGPDLFLDSRFREGFRHLAPRGLSFEGWCYHPQIPGLTDLARAFPDTTIVLDHFGGPIGVGPYAGKEDEVFDAWRRAIGPLAECPNVVAKLGGIAMEVNGFGWHLRDAPPASKELMEATRRYYEHTIEIFGVERCMFESNFPVDKMSCSYRVLWNSFKRLTAGWSTSERAQLFHDTAARVYRLESTTGPSDQDTSP